MSVVFECPHWHVKLKVERRFAGKERQCPKCKNTLTVPEAPRRGNPEDKGQTKRSPKRPWWQQWFGK